MATVAPPHQPSSTSPAPGTLALAFQEVLTVAVRLRANRQVAPDAASFRRHVMQLLATADRSARTAGYRPQDVKLAVYAVVALVDETVLDASQPMFADWSRQSLQEEVFGGHVAGETFFRHVAELTARQDSAELADLLEVYQQCMFLGFRGRYGTTDAGGLRAATASVGEKIHRIRGDHGPLSPSWQLPAGETVAPPADPWVPRLVRVVAGLAVVALLLFLLFRLNLNGRTDDVVRAADQALRSGS